MSKINVLNNLADSISRRETLLFSQVQLARLDELIASRDSEAFEQRWLEVFEPIDQSASKIPEPETTAIDRLREVTFKAAFSVSDNADFAAFVSDDFELIGRAVVLQINDAWLNGLWLEYKNDGFPTEQISEVEGDLESLIV